MTPIETHDDAIAVLRATLPGITDVHVFEWRRNPLTGRRSDDIAPRPNARGWSCTVPRLGRYGAVVAGAWVLPTTAESIASDARAQVEQAIRQREREMVYEREMDEA